MPKFLQKYPLHQQPSNYQKKGTGYCLSPFFTFMLTLIIGNKNYSSWSLRPWLALKQTDQPFKEIRIPIHQENSLKEILQYSPSGRVPCLIDGEIKIWESLAICEYLAERFPKSSLWPADSKARSYARSISNEMHGGFQALRKNLPMDIRGRYSKSIPQEAQDDIDRITGIWQDCRIHYGRAGAFLFGHFTIADAMYAPVVTRFITYDIKVSPAAQVYMESILALPAMKEWIKAAHAEKETIVH